MTRQRGALTLLVLGIGCTQGTKVAIPHEALATTAPLQAAFNADSGHVRAIFLASPT